MAVEEKPKKKSFNPPDPEVNPIGHMLSDYEAWVEEQEKFVQIEYIEDDDAFRVIRDEALPVAVYPSEIDDEFYGDDQAVFVEAEIGPPGSIELDELMRFSGDELVLSRISQAERDEDEYVIVVEAALPLSMVNFPLLDLMVREVANIAADITTQLADAESEDEEDEDDDFEENDEADEDDEDDEDDEADEADEPDPAKG